MYDVKFETNDTFAQQCKLEKSYEDDVVNHIGETNLLIETFVQFLKAASYSDEIIEKYIKVENIESF